jgi:signal transduction histidine kinase
MPQKGRWLPYAVVAAMLLVTFVATYLLHRSTKEHDQLRFNTHVRRTEINIRNRIESYRTVLRSARSLFGVHKPVTQAEFSRYIAMMEVGKRFPGIQGVGFARRSAPDEIDSLGAALTGIYSRPISIYPAEPKRDMYFPIIYLEPQDVRNRVAIGFDMFSERTRQKAMATARDTGYAVASGKVTLVQEIDNKKQPGFLIYLPVYQSGGIPSTIERRRNEIIGFVYSPFRAGDLLSTIMEADTVPAVGFEVFDGSSTEAASLLHVSPELLEHRGQKDYGRFSRTVSLQIASRTWTMRCYSLPAFEQFSSKQIVPAVFALGSLVSVLVFLVLRTQWRGRVRAERAAAELLRSEEALRLAKDAAERANSTKDQFLAVLSHELRTPLTPILTAVELLESEQTTSPELRTWIELIKRNVELEARLIDDLLDVTRIVRGKVELRYSRVDAHRTLDHIYETCKPEALHHSVNLIYEKRSANHHVVADVARLHQIYWNLVKNAIKFTPAGGLVRLQTRSDENYFIFTLTDTGIGIEPEAQSKIFDAFEQGEKTITRQFGGLGLGLAITRSLVEMHNGYITVFSEGRDKGAKFEVGLPLANLMELGSTSDPSQPKQETLSPTPTATSNAG